MKKFSSLSDLKSLISKSDQSSVNSFSTIKKSQFIKQSLEAHYSIKGRAGKPVTLIKGFKGTKNQIKDLAKLLKNQCGVGGSIKDGDIIIQGQYRDKITSILIDMGHSVKRVGG